jgi:hypothetical protein
MALKNQATSTGTLTDITKVVSLIDAMGNNLRTNIDAKEIQTIMKLAADTQESDIHRLSFIEEDNMLMTTGSSPDGQSIVRPVAGLYDYSQIRKYLRDNIFATPLSKEGAKIAVLNGGGPAGQAQLEADELTEDGFDVVYVGNADEDITASYAIYKLGQEGSLPLAKAELEKILKVSAKGTLLAAPAELSDTRTAGAKAFTIGTGFEGRLSVAVSGLDPALQRSGSVAKDAATCFDFSVPAGAPMRRADKDRPTIW